jgi:hypothetical protein
MANRDISWLFDKKVCKFMRKGEIGDWRNYFTFAQSEFFDAIYTEKLKDTGLSFQFQATIQPSLTSEGSDGQGQVTAV